MTGTSARLRQLRVAKARLAASFVVLDLDWLPLSAPLLCRRLGYCGEPARAALAAPGAACGINATLAGLGARERGEALARLAERNALDLELYAFARRLVRRRGP